MYPPSTPKPADDGLEWLREIRGAISTRFDHDPKKYGDYLREREAKMGSRVVRTQNRVVPVTSKGSNRK